MTNNDTVHRPLGWALIGCGGAGNGHAQWATSTPDIAVRGFCDTRADSAKRFHDEYGGEYHTTDPGRIFADPLVDIVSIAMSHNSHVGIDRFKRHVDRVQTGCFESGVVHRR